MGLSLQQDCSRNCGDPARRRNLGNARDLYCRISIGLLGFAAAAGAACSFSPVWTARLRTLACIFTSGLAHILAGVCWLNVPRGSFGNHYLFSHALTGESRSDAAEEGVGKGGTRCPQRVGKKKGNFCCLTNAPSAIGSGIVFGEADPPLTAWNLFGGRLPIRTRRLRCSGSRVFMHSSRRFLIVFSVFLSSAALLRSAGAAEAYLIADAQTGYILEEQESRKKLQVGSLTKIAAASVVLDWAERRSGDLNQAVPIPQEAFVGTLENNIGFQPGDNITLRDLLYAALVQSDNIAAYTLAYHVGSKVESLAPGQASSKYTPVDAFVAQMNALAKQLKMDRTRFVNPHGVDYKVKPMPYSTAEDMARLTRYAMNKASFRFYVSQKERQISFDRAGRRINYMLRNTNELLGKMGIDGVKTGRTARSGDCLILYANRQAEVVRQGQMETVYPRHLMIVLLGSTNRFGEGTALLQRGWQLYDQWAAGGRVADSKKML